MGMCHDLEVNLIQCMIILCQVLVARRRVMGLLCFHNKCHRKISLSFNTFDIITIVEKRSKLVIRLDSKMLQSPQLSIGGSRDRQ